MGRRRKYTNDEIEQWAEEYKRLHSFKKVEAIFGVSARVIQKILERDREKFGIETRKSLSKKELKRCSTDQGCGEIKSFDCFRRRSGNRSHILLSLCIECQFKYFKEYKEENREEIATGKRKHQIKNKEKILKHQKEYREKNKERLNKNQKKYREAHKKEINEWSNKKFRTNINFKLASILRSRLRHAIKNNQKAGSAVEDLGCSIPELKLHLERQFYNNKHTNDPMTWDNHSLEGWHIDHIKPLASFDLTDREQFLEACHYTNLQPLWAEDNLSKGAKIL